MNQTTEMKTDPSGEITDMLQRASEDPKAAERLWETCYRDLRLLARRVMLNQEDSLTPTGLVHEVFFRLSGTTDAIRDRGHFFALACRAMRQVNIQRYRARHAQKRQANFLPTATGMAVDCLALEQAMLELEKQHPRLARVVETRFYAGFSRDEAAELLAISPATLDRDWVRARTYLLMYLAQDPNL